MKILQNRQQNKENKVSFIMPRHPGNVSTPSYEGKYYKEENIIEKSIKENPPSVV